MNANSYTYPAQKLYVLRLITLSRYLTGWCRCKQPLFVTSYKCFKLVRSSVLTVQVITTCLYLTKTNNTTEKNRQLPSRNKEIIMWEYLIYLSTHPSIDGGGHMTIHVICNVCVIRIVIGCFFYMLGTHLLCKFWNMEY